MNMNTNTTLLCVAVALLLLLGFTQRTTAPAKIEYMTLLVDMNTTKTTVHIQLHGQALTQTELVGGFSKIAELTRALNELINSYGRLGWEIESSMTISGEQRHSVYHLARVAD
jgi:hypothetical protein